MQKVVSTYLLRRFTSPKYIIKDFKSKGFRIDYDCNQHIFHVRNDNYERLTTYDLIQLLDYKLDHEDVITKGIELFNSIIHSDEFKYREYLDDHTIEKTLVELVSKKFQKEELTKDYSLYKFYILDGKYQIRISKFKSIDIYYYSPDKYQSKLNKQWNGDYIQIFYISFMDHKEVYQDYKFVDSYPDQIQIGFHKSIMNQIYHDKLYKKHRRIIDVVLKS